MNSNFGLMGEYRVVVERLGGGCENILEFPEIPNLIPEAGIDSFFIASSWASDCHVGSGTTPPALSDTSLGVYIAKKSYTAYSNNKQTTAPYKASMTITYEFAIGAVVGTITEMGIFSTSGAIFSRTLIKDSNGIPTSISLTSTDKLYVYYTVSAIPNPNDTPFSALMGSIATTGIIRPYGLNLTGYWKISKPSVGFYADFTIATFYSSAATPVNMAQITLTKAAYVPGSKKVRMSCLLPAFTGDKSIGFIRVSNTFIAYDYIYDVPLVKLDNVAMTFNFEISCNRV